MSASNIPASLGNLLKVPPAAPITYDEINQVKKELNFKNTFMGRALSTQNIALRVFAVIGVIALYIISITAVGIYDLTKLASKKDTLSILKAKRSESQELLETKRKNRVRKIGKTAAIATAAVIAGVGAIYLASTLGTPASAPVGPAPASEVNPELLTAPSPAPSPLAIPAPASEINPESFMDIAPTPSPLAIPAPASIVNPELISGPVLTPSPEAIPAPASMVNPELITDVTPSPAPFTEPKRTLDFYNFDYYSENARPLEVFSTVEAVNQTALQVALPTCGLKPLFPANTSIWTESTALEVPAPATYSDYYDFDYLGEHERPLEVFSTAEAVNQTAQNVTLPTCDAIPHFPANTSFTAEVIDTAPESFNELFEAPLSEEPYLNMTLPTCGLEPSFMDSAAIWMEQAAVDTGSWFKDLPSNTWNAMPSSATLLEGAGATIKAIPGAASTTYSTIGKVVTASGTALSYAAALPRIIDTAAAAVIAVGGYGFIAFTLGSFAYNVLVKKKGVDTAIEDQFKISEKLAVKAYNVAKPIFKKTLQGTKSFAANTFLRKTQWSRNYKENLARAQREATERAEAAAAQALATVRETVEGAQTSYNDISSRIREVQAEIIDEKRDLSCNRKAQLHTRIESLASSVITNHQTILTDTEGLTAEDRDGLNRNIATLEGIVAEARIESTRMTREGAIEAIEKLEGALSNKPEEYTLEGKTRIQDHIARNAPLAIEHYQDILDSQADLEPERRAELTRNIEVLQGKIEEAEARATAHAERIAAERAQRTRREPLRIIERYQSALTIDTGEISLERKEKMHARVAELAAPAVKICKEILESGEELTDERIATLKGYVKDFTPLAIRHHEELLVKRAELTDEKIAELEAEIRELQGEPVAAAAAAV